MTTFDKANFRFQERNDSMGLQSFGIRFCPGDQTSLFGNPGFL